MVKMSGGEALVRSLASEGVEVVFGIPGIHMSGIVAALRDKPDIRLIATRHDQGAAHMADGYARASGEPGVALVAPGVGVYTPPAVWPPPTPGPRPCSSLPAKSLGALSVRTSGPCMKSRTNSM